VRPFRRPRVDDGLDARRTESTSQSGRPLLGPAADPPADGGEVDMVGRSDEIDESRTALKSDVTAWVAGDETRAIVDPGSATDQA